MRVRGRHCDLILDINAHGLYPRAHGAIPRGVSNDRPFSVEAANDRKVLDFTDLQLGD